MHPNEQLLTRFYEAFSRRDGAAMAQCYAPDATFSDPVFQGLTGAEPGEMWKMLCARGKDLQVTFSDVRADDATGSAHWEATYTFSGTGRKVHNVIDASFTFKDGKIHTHEDRFDLKAWMGMALGPVGKLLGWAPPLQSSIRKKARAGLTQWMSKKA